MHFTFTIVATAAVVVASVIAVPENHVVHEKRDTPRGNFRRMEPHVRLPMRIGLKSNENAKQMAEKWLMDVSHPLSANYGQHWSQKDVIDAFAPSDDTVQAVVAWLNRSGNIFKERITHTDNKAWLAFDATVEEAEQLLRTEYYVHGDESTMVACDQYYLPQHLQEHIDYVTPGVKGTYVEFTKVAKVKGAHSKRNVGISSARRDVKSNKPVQLDHNSSTLTTCDQLITPACIRALYNIPLPDEHAQVSPDNAMGIFLQSSFYAQEDLNLFFTNFTPYIANGTKPILNSINGGAAPVDILHAGAEADMDLELAIPIIYPQKTVVYQVDDLYWSQQQILEGGMYNTFLDAIDGSYCTYEAYGEKGNDPDLDPTYPNPRPDGYKGQLMCGVYKPTNVISISYMKQEEDLPANYQKRQCDEWLKLGLQGVSVLVASGDRGVGDLPKDGAPNGCMRNDTVFTPTHPNSCPWLTSVGATKVYAGRSVFDPESAANDLAGDPYIFAYSSGGGFSNIFQVPDYQSSAVASYFKEANPPYPYYNNGDYNNTDGIYNRNGRGYPDVAANGDNTAAVYNGDFHLTGGTSAATPIFAGVINRINEERIKRGKGPVGFINPVLYANAHVLNDITNGTNPGCGTDGFSASKGWDPITGLGTPNYPKMLELFLNLP